MDYGLVFGLWITNVNGQHEQSIIRGGPNDFSEYGDEWGGVGGGSHLISVVVLYYGSQRLNEKSDVYSFGVVLLELITGRPSIIRGNETAYIITWVTPMLERGDIHNIVDKRLEGNFSTNSAWKFLEIAMSCVSSLGIQRPHMNHIFTVPSEEQVKR
ncbi:probable LRR receptor-like serine/threonine-protein kinase At4g29180 [Beta vulgaris subsp. vulgaris]|uniref:probable LRR receptor-like serine/threonine-protein kinase At4g29180 n=1 Tax=Beta vulgaris subsp. vulgaris TaxID=3555 RepID=UPI002036D9E0|nr:probable LRR receptor-like serine/threonine-protein kinase At4g29180 [Beta vulgaris subsp. vulgaris]